MKSCVRCGRRIPGEVYYENQTSPMCWNCYCRTQQEKQIHLCTYCPQPIFYGSDGPFYEIRLTLVGDTNGVKACQIMRKANLNKELVYCKARDDSCEGFVLTSHPMTLEFHLRVMSWQDVFFEIHELGYHIHEIEIRCMYEVIGNEK